MAISIDKILTIRAQDYVGPKFVITNRYDLVEVHFFGDEPDKGFSQFATQVPDDAEVVVDYKSNICAGGGSGYGAYEGVLMSGTALIPKK